MIDESFYEMNECSDDQTRLYEGAGCFDVACPNNSVDAE